MSFPYINEKGHEVRESSDGELIRERSVQCEEDPTALRLDYVISKWTMHSYSHAGNI